MKKTLVIVGSLIGALIVVFVVAPFVVLKYTSLPLQAAAWIAKKHNVEMSDFGGNLNSGFTIGNMKSTEPGQEFEAHDIKFLYTPTSDFMKNTKFVIEEMSVDGFIFTEGKGDKKPATAPVVAEKDFEKFIPKFETIEIKKFSVKNGTFKRANGSDVKLTEFSIDHLVASTATKDTTFTAARFMSPDFDVKVPNTSLTATGNLKVTGNLEVMVKPHFSKKIKQNVRFTFKDISANPKTNEYFGSVDGLDGKFKFDVTPKGAMALTIHDLDLATYFNVKTDVQSVDLQAAVTDMATAMTGNYPIMGSVTAFGQKFQMGKAPVKSVIPNLVAFLEQNQVQMGFSFNQFVMQTAAAMASNADAVVPVQMMIQSTNPRVTTDNDKMSYFVFQKPFNRLKAPEKTRVAELIQQFRIGVVVQAQAPTQPATQPTAAANGERVPATAAPAQANAPARKPAPPQHQ